MNAIISVVTTGGYVDLFKLLLYSMKKNSGLADLPYVVICTKEKKYALTTKEKSLLKKYWDNIIFHEIDYDLYYKYGKTNPKYWSIEIFNMIQYDKVMMLDCDNVCFNDMQYLFQQDFKLAMTKERQRPNFSAGLIVANKWYRNPATYLQLIECEGDKGRFGHDQRIYNTFFGENSITEIDRKWHCKPDEMEYGVESYAMIHYWLKPTDEKHRKRLNIGIVEIWDKLYDECQQVIKVRGK